MTDIRNIPVSPSMPIPRVKVDKDDYIHPGTVDNENFVNLGTDLIGTRFSPSNYLWFGDMEKNTPSSFFVGSYEKSKR
jgi:hypothetical protein